MNETEAESLTMLNCTHDQMPNVHAHVLANVQNNRNEIQFFDSLPEDAKSLLRGLNQQVSDIRKTLLKMESYMDEKHSRHTYNGDIRDEWRRIATVGTNPGFLLHCHRIGFFH